MLLIGSQYYYIGGFSMKSKRLVALLCALLMALSVVSLASAEGNAKYFGYESSYYTLSNGKTVSFILMPSSHTLYTSDGSSYTDVIYDCEGPVKATVKSGKDWITVKNTMSSFIVTFSSNRTMKARTGKIVVKGDGYKATMNFTQYGCDKILSAVRTKKAVTLKFKFGTGAKAHYLSVDYEAHKIEDDMSWWGGYNELYRDKITKKSYKFNVAKGNYYWFDLGPALAYKSGDYTYYRWSTTSYGGMFVEKVTGTQSPDYLYNNAD